MIVYVNSNNEIKDVGVSADTSLIPIEITDGTFDGWSEAKVCCYRINVVDGNVTMLTPYVDSRMIDHFDQVGSQTESVQTSVSGSYSPTKDYHENEYCLFYGNLYRFIRTMGRGISPLNDTYWEMCDVASELNRLVNMINKGE